MKYIEIEKTDFATGEIVKSIQVENTDGSFISFPADNANPNFIAFLQEAQKENDPYFTAWVEAGNDPDEFWTVELTQEI